MMEKIGNVKFMLRSQAPFLGFYGALAFLVYFASLGGQFLFDDSVYVLQNHLIKNFDLPGLREIFSSFYKWDYLPLTFLSLSFDYFLFGLNPTGYHVTNTLLHIGNVFLVHLIAFELCRSRFVAVGTALLFLVHPVHVESVAWISERKNVLSFFFLFLSLYSYLKLERRALSLVCFILACLSKSSVVIFPLLLVLYELSFGKKKLFAAGFRTLPYHLIAAAFVGVTLLTHSLHGTIQPHPGGSPWNTLFSMLVVYKEYLKTLLLPVNLNVWYPNRVHTSLLQPEVLVSGIVLGVYLFCTALSYRKDKRVFFGLAWFAVSLLPVSHIVPIPQMMADRFLYIPSFGLFLVISLGVHLLWQRRVVAQNVLAFSVCGVLLVLCALSLHRIPVFADDLTLWQDSVAKNENNTHAQMHLGFSYLNAGETEPALAALARAVAIEPDNAKAMRIAALIHERNQQHDKAEAVYRRLIAMNPEKPGPYTSLGILKGNQGELEEALALFDRALSLDPDFALAHFNRGVFHFQAGRRRLAFNGYRKAAQLRPDSAPFQYQLGMFYVKVLSEPELGRRHLARSLRLNPDQPNAMALRAMLQGTAVH